MAKCNPIIVLFLMGATVTLSSESGNSESGNSSSNDDATHAFSLFLIGDSTSAGVYIDGLEAQCNGTADPRAIRNVEQYAYWKRK